MSILLCVLFVEDMEEDVVLMVCELKCGGFDLIWEWVDDEQVLLVVLQVQCWDIVILDYLMLMFFGVEVLKLVKVDNDQMFFIIVFGVIGEQMVVEVMKVGVQDYFLKSVIVCLLYVVDCELCDVQVWCKQCVSVQVLCEMQVCFNVFMNVVFMLIWIKDVQLCYSYVNLVQLVFYGMILYDMDGMIDVELMIMGGVEVLCEYDCKVLEEKCELYIQEIVFDYNYNVCIFDVVCFLISGEGKGDMVVGLVIDVIECEQLWCELELVIQCQ